MPVYRYRHDHVNIALLSKRVPGALVFGSQTPVYVDITAPSGSKPDLDEEMARAGYTYVATDPATTPTAQAAAELGVSSGTVLLDDHFVTGQATTGLVGKLGWKLSATGTGAALTMIAGVVGHPGIVTLEAGTALAAKTAIMLGDSTAAGHFILNASQNQLDMYWVVRPRASIAAANLEVITVGWGQEWTATGDLLNGVYVRYLPGTDTNWTLVCANGGVRTASPGSSAPVVGTWVKLGIRLTFPRGVPTAQLLVDDVAQGTPVTTNFPASAVGVGAKIDSNAGATEPLLDVDEMKLTQQ